MIDYDLRKIRAFVFDVDGVLSPTVIPVGPDGAPMRMANIKDGYVLQLAAKLGYKIAIISGGDSEAVVSRYSMLGIKDIFMRSALKLPVLEKWMRTHGLSTDEVIYMGDDIPDIPAMHYVECPCAPADAAIEVRSISRYISPYPGGEGCVRDVISQVMAAHSDWMHDLHAYGW